MKWLESSRKLAPEPVYITYRKYLRPVSYVYAAAMLMNVLAGSNVPLHAVGIALSIVAGALWLLIGVPYVLAWDELQRRALAESGAIAASATLFILMSASLMERLGLPSLPAVTWFCVLAASWCIALPLVRSHYEA